MALETFCANLACRRRLLFPDSTAGQTVRCATCKHTFIAGASTTTGTAGSLTSTSQPTVADSIGATFGRFIVRAKLGAGAFGTVYRAFDPILDRDVALKVLNPGMMSDGKRVERFLREAKAAAQLRHPHIVAVFDAGTDGDRYYIASAFIEGQPLAETIPEAGSDFARAARIVRELVEALAYAHKQGIVHRDVKPQNIMVDAQDRAHLMDFGLAARQDEETRITHDGAVMGTPSYMAPEQAGGVRGDAKPAIDQYAAGVVLYELLTGRTPFSGPLAVVLHNVIHTAPDSPRKFRPDLPKDLETICLKAMSKRPEDRYADCQAFADDLRRWMEGEPILARRLAPSERFTRWVNKEPKLAIAATAIAVLLMLALGLMYGSGERARENARTQEALRKEADAATAQAEKEAADARAAEKRAEDEAARALTAQANEERENERAKAALAKAESEQQKAQMAATEAESRRKEAEEERKKAAEALARLVEEERQRLAADEKVRQAAADLEAARNRADAYALGRPQLYGHVLRQIESKRLQATDALETVPVALRDWEWQFLNRGPSSIAQDWPLPGPRGSVYCVNPAGSLAAIGDNKNTKLLIHDLKALRTNSYLLAFENLDLFKEARLLEITQLHFTTDTAVLIEMRLTRPRTEDRLGGKGSERVKDQEFSVVGLFNLEGKGKWDALLSNFFSGCRIESVTPDKQAVVVAASAESQYQAGFNGPCASWLVGKLRTDLRLTSFVPGADGVSSTPCVVSGDLRFIASEGSIRRLERETKLIRNLDLPAAVFNPAQRVSSQAFSSTGAMFAVSVAGVRSQLRTIHVYPVKDSTAPRRVLLGHTGVIRVLAFSRSENRLASGAEDGTVKVWDLTTQECLLTLPGPGGTITQLQFTPDGTRLMAVTDEGTFRVWDGSMRKK